MADELPERGIRVDKSRATTGAARLHGTAGRRFEVGDLAVEPHAPVADARGPFAQVSAMLRTAAAAKVDDQLDGDEVVVADDREIGDADTRAPAGVEQRMQRAAAGEPRGPVDEPDGAVAENGRTEVRVYAVHPGESRGGPGL